MSLSADLNTLIVFMGSFFVALLLLPNLALVAQRIDLMDRPHARKVHLVPRPLVGGIGMVLAVFCTTFFFIPANGLSGFFLGTVLLLLVGFLDDLKEIGHHAKFVAQIIAAALMVYFSKTVLYSFGDLLGLGSIDIPVTWLASVLTVFCVVGVINSLNMIDGLDGLAGGVAFVAFLAFAGQASLTGQYPLLLLSLACAGALLGFLRFNWYPSVLFMGDAGSLCLGFALSYMAISLTQGGADRVAPVSALLILTVPVADTLTLMARRCMQGKNPFKADKLHLHHILLRCGLGRKSAVKVMVGLTIVFSGCSFLGPVYGLSDSGLFLIFGIYFTGYFIASFFICDLVRYCLQFKRKRQRVKSAGK